MKILASAFIAGVVASAGALAASPADAPSGTMGKCKDGTYSTSAEKKGACRGHKGVEDWYGESPASPAVSERSPAPAPSAKANTKEMSSPTPAVAGRTSAPVVTQAAEGGGPGKVWGNMSSKVYHCSGDKYYGRTKHGEYMSEADAKAKGYHADHGKACA